MNKKIAFILSLVLLLGSIPLGIHASSYAQNGVYFDFSDYIAEKSGSYYKDVLLYRGTVAEGQDPEGKRGKNMKQTVPDSGTVAEWFLKKSVEADCVYAASLYLDQNAMLSVSAKDLNNQWTLGTQNIIRFSSGNIMFMGSKDANIVGTMPSAGWYDFRIWCEFSAHKMHIFMITPDKTVLEKEFSLNEEIGGYLYLSLVTNATGTAYDLYTDNIAVYNITEDNFSYSLTKGEIVNESMSEMTVDFHQDAVCSDVQKAMRVYDGENKDVSFAAEPVYTGGYRSGAKLTFTEPLDEFTEYYIALNDGITNFAGATATEPVKIFSAEPEISISTVNYAEFPTGAKLMFDADVKKPKTAAAYFVANGIRTPVDGSLEYVVKSGDNSICAVVVDAQNNILVQSNTVTFTGVDYDVVKTNTDDDFDLRVKAIKNYAADESNGKAEIVSSNSDKGKVLQLTSKANATSQAFCVTQNVKEETAGRIIAFEGDFRFMDFAVEKGLMRVKGYKPNSDTAYWPASPVTVNTKGEFVIAYYEGKSSQQKVVGKANKGQWYHVKAVYNLATALVDCYLDGVLVSYQQRIWPTNTEYECIDYINIGSGIPATGSTTMYIDNLKSYTIAPRADYSVSYNGVSPYPYHGFKADISFSNAMDEESLNNITVMAADGTKIKVETVYSNQTYTLIFPELAPDTEYTVSIKGVKTLGGAGVSGDETFTFVTDKLPFCIKGVTTSQAGNTVTLSVQVRFGGENHNSGILNACIYDDKAMLAASAKEVTSNVSGTTINYTFNLDVSKAKAPVYGVYLLDSIKTLNIIDSVFGE